VILEQRRVITGSSEDQEGMKLAGQKAAVLFGPSDAIALLSDLLIF
jgi:hypothetical protein